MIPTRVAPRGCVNNVANSTLTGHNDWSVISIPFRQFGDSADSAINPCTDPEPTLAEQLELRTALNTTDVGITIADAPDPAAAGTPLVYTLTAANHGPNPASQVQVVITLPVGVTYQSDTGGCAQGPEGTLTCNLGERFWRGKTSKSRSPCW